MSDEPDFLPPLEIPWKLASTTQQMTGAEPAETTISFFTYQPDDDALTTKFKDHRIVFLKITTSISPAAFPPGLTSFRVPSSSGCCAAPGGHDSPIAPKAPRGD